MAKGLHGRGVRRLSAWVGVCSVVLMGLEWILLVAGVRAHEMMVGAVSVGLSAAFVFMVYRTSEVKTEFRWVDVAQGWRIPWYIVSDLWTITVVLGKELLGIEAAGSLYRVCGFKTSKTEPRLVARRVLATVYTTAGPNSIILGIDYEQSRMLFHQLERSGVAEMTKALGAQA